MGDLIVIECIEALNSIKYRDNSNLNDLLEANYNQLSDFDLNYNTANLDNDINLKVLDVLVKYKGIIL